MSSWTKEKEEKLLKRLRENDPVLTYLYLRGKRIGDEGARALADVLRTNTILETLHLCGNNIGDEGARAIARALEKNSTLIDLELFGNHIGPDGARALADALEANGSLKVLSIGNNIGDDGARAVANALEKNSTITDLLLQGNNIGDEGASALARALKKNSTVTKLWLGRNSIGDDGARALAVALTKNSTLKELRLSGNKIGDHGATALADALKTNTVVTHLCLGHNIIGDDGARAFGDVLENNNTTLTSLSLGANLSPLGVKTFYGDSNPFGTDERIDPLLERNKRLLEYDIIDNNTELELVFGDNTIEELDQFLEQVFAESCPNKRQRVDEGPLISNGNETEMEHQTVLSPSSNEDSLENDILQTAPRADKKNGGGRKYQFHAGNMRLNQIMITFVEAYQAGSRVEKRSLVLKILARVKEAGGRFLKQQSEVNGKDVWVEQTEEEVRDKISRRFKDFKKKFVALEKAKSNQAVASLETQMESLAVVDLTHIYSLPKTVKASNRSYLVATFVIGTDPNHSGDVRFRQMVRERYQDHQKAGWVEKAVIESELCTAWKNAGGRFMKSIGDDWWTEQTEEEIVAIITSVFQDIEEQMERTPWKMSEEPNPLVPDEAPWRKIVLGPL